MSVEKYCKLVLSDIPEVNMLGTWVADKNLCEDELAKASKIDFEYLSLFLQTNHGQSFRR